MAFTATQISYASTGFYSKIVTDYLNNAPDLIPFFAHKTDIAGLQQAISNRNSFHTDRSKLADILQEQYQNIHTTEAVQKNIALLKNENTFTITTAHQPNIFTGPLYFLYKILHAIKLAEYSKKQFPQHDFVPVYYMGSEDADLEELGHIYVNGEKLEWNTSQTGAVGRMLADKNLLALIEKISGETGTMPYGNDIIDLIKKNYKEGVTIQQATLQLVNDLFGAYGLLVVIPDNASLKQIAYNIFKEELLHGHSQAITEETGKRLSEAGYSVQAHSRDVNFFYLKKNKRERIEKKGDQWKVVGTDIAFTKAELLLELENNPERFSPNVILRGIFQETILPNIAFIGGGGELAYWLQLKALFDFYKVPYPLLVLRNSYLITDEKASALKNKLDFNTQDLFKPVLQLQNEWIQKNTNHNLNIDAAIQQIHEAYNTLSSQAESIDTSLLQHVGALKSGAIKRVGELGKKMLRSEKRNHEAAMRQIDKLKQRLFPKNNLQERIDNFTPYYAAYGPQWINDLYINSLALEQEFVVLEKIKV